MQSLVPSMMSSSEPGDSDGDGQDDPASTSAGVPGPTPPITPETPKRRLLIIYIHGYNGNNQSFKSFPAHVHKYLKLCIGDTHLIHTKVYPRYKTYKAMDVGVERFSEWLQPHENEDTDVILVGHSMGGILAAEVVLLVGVVPLGLPCSASLPQP